MRSENRGQLLPLIGVICLKISKTQRQSFFLYLLERFSNINKKITHASALTV